ncbi:MAG TPA: UDP-N-acetylmuramoyl-L-alanine--D-glutamate ligase [Coprobacter fastidiosus]|jgi:UDP-N-acetylmuramoyl-L-alanine--D-glutamate ligase|uniref:UDP-N-acetylmuramoylalanine--D-glutamate ligase n=1 Tax=Coprobacter fastidiosus TaxID=1099853 RepID=A0A354M210_9BACT|nr:UDP-N-acetylmuramoyl-L-alanine--D-glutamate ligase [Coprobacter fastidiosus]MBS6409309.1 UDP-N-acetylmuramoyl-L-alanine--D-glutamate ligase [Tannerella sp.]HBJ08549.1 UDP-N-acetylmuramoyl-L-alanine--D-glutamate ligase [Coprobacter fastidiosus]HJF42546.1 UDP-N-acetylmuramoyl-L-alanine--D-glutamate ligase [Coprobacter fastidiosus]
MNKRIVVLGAGESGAGAAVLAKVKGFDVFVSDMSLIKDAYKALLNKYEIEWEDGRHSIEKILNADEIIKSPGIPDTAPVIREIQKKGIPIISEIEFAGRYTHAKMICITGSNGKTTTTLLTYHILKNAGLNVGLAGNVGKSLALQVATENFDYYVIELSSFQLDNMYKFKADIAVLLNITPDHLDRYGYDMQNYINAKFRITQNQTPNDAFIYWNDDPIITKELKAHDLKARLYPFSEEKEEGVKAYTENNQIVIDAPNDTLTITEDDLALQGRHNLYNSMAASISAKVLDIKKEDIREGLKDFKGVEHRLEKVARVRGVEFINDSKATNVNSCWYALESMRTKVILILGGKDKGNDYSEIEELVKEKVNAIICLGVDNSKLHAFFEGKVPHIEDASSMKEAVDKAFACAQKGETVLLSPCCASFDLFKSYEDRGEQFKECVRNL